MPWPRMSSAECQLLKSISRGDVAAFEALYDGYAGRLLGLLVRWLRDRRDADDVLQETFWQVWKTAGTFDASRRSVMGWLVMIARSRAYDCLRRKGRVTTAVFGDGSATDDDPFTRLQQQEAGKAVTLALAELDEAMRQAVCLAFYDGMTHVEIAQRLQIPLGTAKTRIRQGMLQLRSRLRGLEEGTP